VASLYGNLGNVYLEREDFASADEHYRKALEIAEQLGLLESMATQHGNLGVVFHARGDLDNAKEQYSMAIAIAERLDSRALMESLGSLLDDLGRAGLNGSAEA
jgi:tetratricopeptide (TPR) repeat protein